MFCGSVLLLFLQVCLLSIIWAIGGSQGLCSNLRAFLPSTTQLAEPQQCGAWSWMSASMHPVLPFIFPSPGSIPLNASSMSLFVEGKGNLRLGNCFSEEPLDLSLLQRKLSYSAAQCCAGNSSVLRRVHFLQIKPIVKSSIVCNLDNYLCILNS